MAAVLVLNTPDDGRLTPETCRVTAEIKPAQCCIKLVFYLTYTTMHGNKKLKFHCEISTVLGEKLRRVKNVFHRFVEGVEKTT